MPRESSSPEGVLHTGYMNIYKSGWFHRANKPGMYDRHPGDLYPTYDAAIADIEPKEMYVTTVPVQWVEAAQVPVNPPDAVPVGLAVSRAALRAEWEAALESV